MSRDSKRMVINKKKKWRRNWYSVLHLGCVFIRSFVRLCLPTSNNHYHDRRALASHLTSFIIIVVVVVFVHISIIKYQFTRQLFWFSIVNISHLPFTQSLSRTTIPNIYIHNMACFSFWFAFFVLSFYQWLAYNSDIHRSIHTQHFGHFKVLRKQWYTKKAKVKVSHEFMWN